MVKDRREAILSLLLRLRAMGLPLPLIAAFEAVPRQNFVPVMHLDDSYGPGQLPIECGQTMTSPDVIARILLALDLARDHRVLEIGTGSGYQTALLAKLSEKVVSLERWHTLAEKARVRLSALDIDNVAVELADGRKGRPGEVFDRIVANCAYPEIPRHFLDQLVAGGVVIAPVGPPDGLQALMRLTKEGSRFDETRLFSVRMQAFGEGIARAI
jgi:protein-L-isoaspartate(D-aspartate) O-methyltransferase